MIIESIYPVDVHQQKASPVVAIPLNGTNPSGPCELRRLEPKKVFRALMAQIGTAAPVVTVLENSLGGTVVWTREGAGIYKGTLVGAFPPNKCFTVIARRNAGLVSTVTAKAPNVDSDDILVETHNGTIFNDNLMGDGCCLEVIVFP